MSFKSKNSCIPTDLFCQRTEYLQTVLNSEPFIFVINGQELKFDIVEAILLSPFVCDQLLVDRSTMKFFINDKSISPKHFEMVVELSHGSAVTINTTFKDSILSLCHILGNNNLEIICLACFLTTDSHSETICVNPNSCKSSPQSMIAQNFDLCSIETLLRLDSDLLDDILTDESLLLSNEDELLKVLIKLAEFDSSYAQLFHNIHFELLTFSALSNFIDCFNFSNLTPMIWVNLSVLFTKIVNLELPKRRYFCSGLNSVIVTGLPPLFPDLNDEQFNLLYRTSRDGYVNYTFHKLCDGRGNALIILLDPRGFIFGGYTPVL
jgi:hypothetical protein